MIRKALSATFNPRIICNEYGTAGIIQLNRPEVLNALTLDMVETMYDVVNEWEHQKSVVVIKGAEKVFCAGGDLKKMNSSTIEENGNARMRSYRQIDTITNYKIPYVALIDGVAIGAAAAFTIPGKYRIATERASFMMPENTIGFFNDAGSAYFLPRLENNFGIYMGLTGTQVYGYDMVKTNLATHFITSDKLRQLEDKLIDCKNHDDVSSILKKFSSIPQSTETKLDSIMPKIKKSFGASTVEEIFENLEQDGSEWAMKTLQILKQKSPTSLKISHRCMNLGKVLPLRDILKMEYAIVMRFKMIKSDFKEGCRAILIDKDFKPKWNPSTLSEVTNERVDEFFQPLPKDKELSFINDNLLNKL